MAILDLIRNYGNRRVVREKDKAIIDLSENGGGGSKFGKILRDYEITVGGDTIVLPSQALYDYSLLYNDATGQECPSIITLGLQHVPNLITFVDEIELFGVLTYGQESIDLLEDAITQDCLINETGETNEFLLDKLVSGHDAISASLFLKNNKYYLKAIKYFPE